MPGTPVSRSTRLALLEARFHAFRAVAVGAAVGAMVVGGLGGQGWWDLLWAWLR